MPKYRYTFTKSNGARIVTKANTLSGAIERAALTTLDDWTYIREPGIRNAVFITFVSEEEDGESVCVCNIATPRVRDAIVEHRGDWIIQLGLICQDQTNDMVRRELLSASA